MENIVKFDPEKAACDALVRNAKEMNGVKYIELPLSLLVLDEEYQRGAKDNWRKIAAEWDDYKAGNIIVSYRGARFIVIDGANRCRAAMSIGKETINSIIYTGLTLEEEAILFAEQDENKRRVTQAEKLNAKRVGKDESALAISDICKEYGIGTNRSWSKNAVYLGSISAAQQLFANHGSSGLRWAFEVVREAGWHGALNAYGDAIMGVLDYAYGVYGAASKADLVELFAETQPNLLVARAQIECGIQGRKRAMVSFLANHMAA